MAVDPLLLGNIIQGGAQLIGGMFNGYSQRSAVKEANKGNMELAKYQNARNIELWNANNEYNTPGAQMGRLQEAGLNPNLVYGSGSAVGNTSSPPPSTAVPTMQPAPFLLDSTAWNGLSQIADTALKAANIERTNQETENLKVYQQNARLDGDLKELEKISRGYANAKSKAEAEVWAELYANKLTLLKAEGVFTRANTFKVNADRQNTLERTRYLRSVQTPLGNAQIDLLKSQKGLTDANRDLSLSNIVLNEFRKGLISANIEQALSSANVNRQQSLKIANEIINLQTDNRIKFEYLTEKQQENLIRQILIDQGVDLRDGNLIRTIVRSINNKSVFSNFD